MAKTNIRLPLFFLIFTTLLGCKSFMHGYTWDKSQNSYSLVVGDKNKFGDQRIKYNKGFHKNSDLTNFLDCKCKGLPDFIYEYESKSKCRGIKLFYVEIDSVFIFEEPKKGKLQSILKESRRMDNYERNTYERLNAKK